jgi:glycosyltransferase involved in cell wall biosynthesis
VRILHVHSGNIFGGVERIFVALAGHQGISPEFEHHFALCFRDRLARELAAAGGPVVDLPEVRLSRPLSIMRARRALRKILRERQFDVAIVHSAWTHVVFAREILAASVPLVFWLHTRASGNSALERLAQMNFPDAIISVSRWVDESAGKLFPGVASSVVYSPLAIERAAFDKANRDPLRTELGIERDKVVILQASRMEAWKGHRELLHALKELRSEPNWICWIAGGPERQEEEQYVNELHDLANTLGVADRVRFLGRRDDVPALMVAADIYCQANVEAEGFSIAFVEAFYAGLPIVTSAIGGALEIVDADCGILVKARDSEGLAAALRRLILDRELRQGLGVRGRERALERCDPVRQFRELERVFRQIVAQHG